MLSVRPFLHSTSQALEAAVHALTPEPVRIGADGLLTVRKIENVPTGPNNRPKLVVKVIGVSLAFASPCGRFCLVALTTNPPAAVRFVQSVERCRKAQWSSLHER